MRCRKKTNLFVLILAVAVLGFPTGCNRAADSETADQEISSSMAIPDQHTAGSTAITAQDGNVQTASSESEKEEIKRGALFSEDELGSIANGKASLSDDMPCCRCWAPKDQQAVLSKVASWLQTAQSYTGEMPESQYTGVFYANIAPSELHVTTSDNHKITIQPAFYLIKDKESYTKDYVPDVLELDKDGTKSYIQSPELFDWLKNDNWKTEFEPEQN